MPWPALRLPSPRPMAGRWRALAARPPGPCAVCRSWNSATVCGACVARYGHTRPRCRRCAMPTGAETDACGDCLRDPPPFTLATCAVDYDFPWDRLVVDFKFGRRVELAPALAQRLVEAVLAHGGPGAVSLVLPVPLSPARLAERGYNQAWELARRVAGELALTADATLLQRLRGGAHQATLSRQERLHNLRGAYLVDPARRALLQQRHVALVDDVMTTGATAREAAAVLLRAGAASVRVWALARTA